MIYIDGQSHGSGVTVDGAGVGGYDNMVTETVNDTDIYVNFVSGDDKNDGLSSGTAVKTLAKGISLLPTFLKHDTTLYIEGTSTAEGALYLNNIVSPDVLFTISGSSAVLSGTKLVLSNTDVTLSGSIEISNNTGHAIELERSNLDMSSAISGSNNTGSGLYGHTNSKVTISDGSPPTLTGTVGNISADGESDAATWVEIDGGLELDIQGELQVKEI